VGSLDPHRPCHFCGLAVSANGYREITGWEKVRGQGGANAVTLRDETGRVACTVCIDRLKHGVSPDQGTFAL
jgi:hypothetical protein